MSTPKRPAPPTIEARCPDCPICGKETSVIDPPGFTCESCDAYWADMDEPGEWLDETAKQCSVEFQPYKHLDPARYANIIDLRYRCVLDADHGPDHRHPEYIGTWTTEPAEVSR